MNYKNASMEAEKLATGLLQMVKNTWTGMAAARTERREPSQGLHRNVCSNEIW